MRNGSRHVTPKSLSRVFFQKRSKVSDNDGFYMVGGSPNQSGSDTEEESSYSSYDSEEYHRSTYEERRNRRREKYGSNHDRDRDRDRGKKEKKNRETEKEVCLRFADTGRCPDVSSLIGLTSSSLIKSLCRKTVSEATRRASQRRWSCASSG